MNTLRIVSRPTKSRWLLPAAALALVTIAAFGGVLRNDWILLDDPIYVFDNSHVNRGWTGSGAVWFLHEPHGGNWHPLTSYSHMLDVQLFGLRPAGHHAVSLLLHALNAFLLGVVLCRLTGAVWRSVLVASLFALHPLRVESVAWISERKDVLSGAFFLATIELYRRWAAHPTPLRRFWVAAGLGLGLMAKPMLVTLPFVLVLLDIWPLARLKGATATAGKTKPVGAPPKSLWRLITEQWDLFALAAASAIITFIVQRKTGAVVSVETVAPLRRVINAFLSYWRYIGKSLYPSHLAPFYPYNQALSLFDGLVAALGLALLTWWVITQVRKRPYLTIGWFWYMGMLLPVIGLIQVGGQAFADRYTYLPCIGLAIAFVWGIGDLVGHKRWVRVLSATVACLALVVLAWATWRQVSLWKDARTLFTYTLAATRNNAVAHQCLGDVLLKEGKVNEAIPHYEEAIRLAPNFADAHNKLGSALGAVGRYDEAVAQLREALGKGGGSAEIHHNLGFALAREGRIDEAVPEFETALRLDPDHYLTLIHLGAALVVRNRIAEAVSLFQHAVEVKPDDREAHRLLAGSLIRLGRIEDGIRELSEILRRDPDNLDALLNIAWIRATHADAEHRNGAEATRLAERARDKSPEPIAQVYGTLAAAYAEAGRFPEAIRAGEKAIQLADSTNEGEDAKRFAEQLSYYRQGRPFHFGG